MTLPDEFVIVKFYELGYRPIYNKFTNVYQCACPICKEGKSFKTKRRCYYIPKNENIFCHNCGWSGKPLKWITEVSGESEANVISELRDYIPSAETFQEEVQAPVVTTTTLPEDSINLSDSSQLNYYKNNDIIRAALHLIKQRRLDTAINKPENLYVSLTDKVHKNRLIIPFVNEHNSIEFYQSRTILTRDNKIKPKYLGRVGSEKTLFNINNVKQTFDNVYIFEGPINAFFTKNSVAVAGITERGRSFTTRQQQQLDTTLKLLKRIWILDSQWIDQASLIKTEALLQQGESVFIWPEKFGKRFKDFNDIAMHCKLNEIKEYFISKHTHASLEGMIKLAAIKRYSSDQR
tara:strand:+ start:4598 stop:5644 length:1047 start_codon:yes stop_codon:yes gene_type:complete